jgi:hypothetical protein
MSDASMASIARDLAKALNKWARERGDAEKKAVAQAQADLCAAYRDELAAPQPAPEGEPR